MKFTGTLRAPRLNLGAYQKQLAAVLGDAIAHAAFEWLGAVTKRVPVWSGASQATFLPLAHAVGYQLSVNATSLPSGRGVPDRTSLGLNNSTGEIEADPSSGKFSFTYSTTLAHLICIEFNNANVNPDPTKFPPPIELKDPGPYEFQKLGQEAFERFAAGVTLPNPFNTVRVKEIRVK